MVSGVVEWLTWPEAAELVGCPVPTIDWYTRTGRIAHRARHGNRPSLERDSVEEFAAWWQERQAERERRRAAKADVGERLARHRVRAGAGHPPRPNARSAAGAPDDERRERLLSDHFPVGSRISVEEVKIEFGVIKQPVMDAMRPPTRDDVR